MDRPHVVAGDGERHQDVARLGDRRIGQQPDEVRLAQGDEVADRHRQRRQHPEDRRPHVVAAEEPDVEQLEKGHEPSGLGRDRQEGGDRRGGALVRVGRPEVEGHRGDLEREADDDEEDPHRHDRFAGHRAADALADLDENRRVRRAKDERHAVEHHRARQHAEQVVLERRLVALQVALAPPGKHVRRDRQGLEGDEDRDEVPRRGHDDHAEQRRQDQEVVLALVVVAFLDVARRHQHDDVADDEEQRLEDEREVVHDVRPADHGATVSIGRESDDGNERGQQPEAGDVGKDPLAAFVEQRVAEQHEHQRTREDDLGRQRVIVELGYPEAAGGGEHHGPCPPATALARRKPWVTLVTAPSVR